MVKAVLMHTPDKVILLQPLLKPNAVYLMQVLGNLELLGARLDLLFGIKVKVLIANGYQSWVGCTSQRNVLCFGIHVILETPFSVGIRCLPLSAGVVVWG